MVGPLLSGGGGEGKEEVLVRRRSYRRKSVLSSLPVSRQIPMLPLCSLISCHSSEEAAVMEIRGLKRTTSHKSMSPFGQGRSGGSSEVFDRQGPAVRSLLRQDSVSYQLVST